MSFRNLFISLSLLLLYTAHAQTNGAGTNPFAFLNLDYDARTIGMGGAAVAMPNDILGIVYNPAAAGYITQHEAVCGFRNIIQDIYGGPVGFAMPFYSYGTVALNLVTVSYGSLDVTKEAPGGGVMFTGDKASAYSVAGNLTWSKIVWESLSLGVALRGIHEALTSPEYGSLSADAACLLAGIQYRLFDSRLIFGLALSNLGFMIASYSQETTDLKLAQSITAGLSYVPYFMPNLRLALDLQQISDADLLYKIGGELAVYKKALFVRAGYRFGERDLESGIKTLKGESQTDYQMTTWYGPAFGLGFVQDINKLSLNVDASLQLITDGVSPAISLNIAY